MSFDIECPGKAYVLSNVNHIVLGDHYWVFANRTSSISVHYLPCGVYTAADRSATPDLYLGDLMSDCNLMVDLLFLLVRDQGIRAGRLLADGPDVLSRSAGRLWPEADRSAMPDPYLGDLMLDCNLMVDLLFLLVRDQGIRDGRLLADGPDVLSRSAGRL
ncbi:hypothetical protein F2Q69_00026868 [Brassica cretica]|uniref:Uncharacterized protein n=1 Tax=Brassica cretica TaxID=69181 RepID=A0A8S9RW92_BRACR|nr:hypothetical protein F2Q69_00026868 [Brassica cretica]